MLRSIHVTDNGYRALLLDAYDAECLRVGSRISKPGDSICGELSSRLD